MLRVQHVFTFSWLNFVVPKCDLVGTHMSTDTRVSPRVPPQTTSRASAPTRTSASSWRGDAISEHFSVSSTYACAFLPTVGGVSYCFFCPRISHATMHDTCEARSHAEVQRPTVADTLSRGARQPQQAAAVRCGVRRPPGRVPRRRRRRLLRPKGPLPPRGAVARGRRLHQLRRGCHRGVAMDGGA